MLASLLASWMIAPPTPVAALGIGNWNQMGDPIVARDARNAGDITAVAFTAGLHAGEVLLIGGRGGVGDVILSEAELYAPAGGFAATGTMLAARLQGGAVELPNGDVLVSGGTGDGTAAMRAAEIWHTSTGTWSATGQMVNPRMGHALYTLPNGKVMAVGGRSTVSGNQLATTELCDIAAGTWSAGPTMAQATGRVVQLLEFSYRLLAVHDDGTSETSYNGNAWGATLNGLTIPRSKFTLTAIPGGRALVLGGTADGFANGVKRTEVYASSKWSLSGTISDSRADGLAWLLPDGTLLILGGKSSIPGDTRPVLTTEKLDLKILNPTTVTPTQDDAVGPTVVRMRNNDLLSVGFREPGTNQQHHSVRYVAPVSLALLSASQTPVQFNQRNVSPSGLPTGIAVLDAINYGGSPVTISTVAAQTSVFQAGGCSGTTLQPGLSCTVSLTFAPDKAIPYSDTLTITSNAVGGTLDVPLYGSGGTGVSPPAINFGPRAIGAAALAPNAIGPSVQTQFSGTAVFTNTNTNGQPVTVTSVTLVSGSTNWSTGADQCTGRNIPAGELCNVEVRFVPQTPGEQKGRLRFTLSDGTTRDVPLSGVGTNANGPAAAFDQTTLNLGSVPSGSTVGQYRSYAFVRVTNRGRTPLIHDGISRADFTGTNAGDFLIDGDQCLGITLQPADSCTLAVKFVPTAPSSTGGRNAQFLFKYHDTANTPYQDTLTLQGIVTGTPNSVVYVGDAYHDFSAVAVGDLSAGTYNAIVRNYGNAAFTVTSMQLDSESLNITDFIVGIACNGVTLQPAGVSGDYCQFTVTFRPTRAGKREAILRANTTAGYGTSYAYLKGTGTGQGQPKFIVSGPGTTTNVSPTSNQGSVIPVTPGTVLGSSLATDLPVVVANTGTGAVGASSLIGNDGASIIGNDGASIVTDNGGGAVAAGAMNLTGPNGAPLITNDGGSLVGPNNVRPLAIASAHYVGIPQQSTCLSVRLLEPGDSCTITIRFAPVSAGAKPATLSLPLFNGTTTVISSLSLTGDGAVPPSLDPIPSVAGMAAGGTSLTLTGAGFVAGAKVFFGVPGGPGITPSAVSATSLTLTTPALNPGDYDVTVMNPDGRASTIGRYHILPTNFVPMVTSHTTAPVMGGPPAQAPPGHVTVVPTTPVGMPTPLSAPVRHG